MIRGRTVMLAWITLVAPALAGDVVFDPPQVTIAPGGTASFTVTIASTGVPSFTSLDILFSSDTPGFVFSFTYADGFQTTFAPSNPIPRGIFPSDLKIGGFQIDGWQAPLLVGTLTVDASNIAAVLPTNVIRVAPDAEQAAGFAPFSKIVSADVVTELVTGSATLIVEEPTAPGGTTGGGTTGGGTTTANAGNGSTNPPAGGGTTMCGVGMIPVVFLMLGVLGLLRSSRPRDRSPKPGRFRENVCEGWR